MAGYTHPSSIPGNFAQTAMEVSLDDTSPSGSEAYTTAPSAFESSDDERAEGPTYATPSADSTPHSHTAHALSTLRIPGMYQLSTSSLNPTTSVHPELDVDLTLPPSVPEENYPMAESDSGTSTPRAHAMTLDIAHRDSDDDDMIDLEDSIEVGRHLDDEHRRSVRPRRDEIPGVQDLRKEITFWKEVSQHRKQQTYILKKRYAEAVVHWKMVQQENGRRFDELNEQTAELVRFMNGMNAQAATQAALRDQEFRIAAQHQVIQQGHAELLAKQAEQERVAEDLRKRGDLLAEREDAVEKDRAALDNQQATVSRRLQQIQAGSVNPRDGSPHIQRIAGSSSSSRQTIPRHVPQPNNARRVRAQKKTGLSTRQFLLPLSEEEPIDEESDNDVPQASQRSPSARPSAVNGTVEVENHRLTMDQIVTAVCHGMREDVQAVHEQVRAIREEVRALEISKTSPRRRRYTSATPEPEPQVTVDHDTRLELLRRVRKLYKEQCGIEMDRDWYGHQEADRNAVEGYNTRGEGSPDTITIAFDMRTAGSKISPWNFAIFQHLLTVFKYANKAFITENDIEDPYVDALIQEKFERGRQMWRSSQPKLTSAGTVETEEEYNARILLGDEKGKSKARANTRRRNKFERRHGTVTKMIALHVNQESQIAVWRFLQKVLDLLGPEGMSSEETCDDAPERLFRVKVLEWRRPMDEYLKIIDGTRVLDQDLFSRQGSLPAKRLRDGTIKSSRPAVRRLPYALYNEEWLQSLNAQDTLTLSVSSEKFEWIRYVVTLAHSM